MHPPGCEEVSQRNGEKQDEKRDLAAGRKFNAHAFNALILLCMSLFITGSYFRSSNGYEEKMVEDPCC